MISIFARVYLPFLSRELHDLPKVSFRKNSSQSTPFLFPFPVPTLESFDALAAWKGETRFGSRIFYVAHLTNPKGAAVGDRLEPIETAGQHPDLNFSLGGNIIGDHRIAHLKKVHWQSPLRGY